MRLCDCLTADTIIPNLSSNDKAGVIKEMSERLYSSGRISDPASVERALIERERLGSTGIGDHVAIPHAKSDNLDGIVGLVARSESGVNFDSLDGKKVHLFFLLLAPSGQPGKHLKLLSRISRLVRLDRFFENMKKLDTAEEIKGYIEEAEQSL